jgi:para-nitrobenzyl esterase
MSADQRAWCLFRRLSAGLMMAYALVAASVASAAADKKVVVTDNGPVRGIVTPTIRKFLGIPYAAPPVGDLRWRPPRSHARWDNPLDATKFGNHCPQPVSPFGLPSVTEDCLFLNVYTPPKINRGAPHRHPVMVWIHGGALFLGESDDYDPSKLVRDGDVIVVTINYRLGFLGFLAHPALSAESPDHASGNYGLMDQQFALQWVQRNISRFGGDPDNVTIFGESGGGLSVQSHLVSPTAAGLFHQAIVESGAYSLTQPPLAVVEAEGTAFATLVGCGNQTAACLRAVPVATILANQGGAGFVPNLDGKLLTQSVGEALASGQFNQVPVMEGSNHDEWRLFVALQEFVTGPLTPSQYPGAIGAILLTLRIPLAVVPLLVAEYPLANYPSPSIALGALGTDGIFACNARLSAQLLSAHVPTFEYEFNDANAPQVFLPPASFPYGAYHAAEIQYLFGLRAEIPAPALNAAQEELSDNMVRYWTQFARSGNPNSPDTLPFWPSYETATDQIQSLVPPTPQIETGFAADHKCAFWASLGG